MVFDASLAGIRFFLYNSPIIRIRRQTMTESIGNTIRRLRLARDLTQAELADALGVTTQAVSNAC